MHNELGNNDSYFRRRVLRFAKNSFEHETPANILDLGCGEGFMTAALANQFPTAHCWGIDGDKEYIEKAQQKYGNRKNVEFVHQPISTIDTQRFHHFFDLVIFCEVIEHLPNPGDALTTIRNIMKPGGTLIVSTDNAFFLNLFVKNIVYSYFKTRPQLFIWYHMERVYDWNHHIFTFTISYLATLAKVFGFDLREYALTNHVLIFNHLRRGRIADAMSDIVSFVFPFFRRKVVLSLKKVPRISVATSAQ